jgi:hypothetical protein
MTFAPHYRYKPQTFAQAYESDEVADLAKIYEPDINVCIVERPVDATLDDFVEHLLRQTSPISFVENVTFESFDFYSLLPNNDHLPGYRAFCQDVARLVGLYCDLFDLTRVGLRVRTLNHAMCPKFHVDSVTCRLICTYGVTGTEWLEEAYTDRSKLGLGSNGLADEKSGLILDADAIHRVPAYAIALFKGSQWEGNEQHGAVHRSPKMTAPRLLLTLDFG